MKGLICKNRLFIYLYHSREYQSNLCMFFFYLICFCRWTLCMHKLNWECFSVITSSIKKHTAWHYSSKKKKKEHIRISTFSCSGRQRPAHSPFLVFLFGLPSLLCPLSKHHSFLLRDPALGCGLPGLATSHSSSTPLKRHCSALFFVSN